MKIDEILNYNKDQQLLQHIGDAFLPNGELKFPVDLGGLVADSESMLDQTVDEVPDDIMDVASVDQRPRPIRQTASVGGIAPARSLDFSARSSGLLATNGREWAHET
jgi:hypothetical protein